MKKWIVLIGLVIVAYACKKADETLPDLDELFPGFLKPGHFPEPVYKFTENEVTEAGFELGKRLFHEPRLSRNNTIACASCHIQSANFTHHGHDVSHGIDDQLGIRNPMPIMNLAWNKAFFWDGGVFNLDLLSIVPIENPVEMGERVPNVLVKLRAHPDYPTLFEKAFGSREITSAKMSKALSQFMLMAVSDNSKYDQVIRGEKGISFTESEQRGYLFFQNNCSRCHSEPLFTDGDFHDNGLGRNPAGDEGRYAVTLNPTDKLKFKVPSLRNLKWSAPYMHDGSIYTLSGVLDHYRKFMQHTENLDMGFRHMDGTRGVAMTDVEKEDLLNFLNTLNDETFVKKQLLSEPGGGFVIN